VHPCVASIADGKVNATSGDGCRPGPEGMVVRAWNDELPSMRTSYLVSLMAMGAIEDRSWVRSVGRSMEWDDRGWPPCRRPQSRGLMDAPSPCRLCSVFCAATSGTVGEP